MANLDRTGSRGAVATDGRCSPAPRIPVWRRAPRGSVLGAALGAAVLLFSVSCGPTDRPPPEEAAPTNRVATSPQPISDEPRRPELPEAVRLAPEELAAYCLDFLSELENDVSRRAMLEALLSGPLEADGPTIINVIDLAQNYLHIGEAEKALDVLTRALRLEGLDELGGGYKALLVEDTAIGYLKMGELDNCLSPTGALICTLPLEGFAAQTDTEGASNALDLFRQLLEMDPDNIKARWLLNIGHMALGTYPRGVPDEYLVPREALGSDYGIGRFYNVAASAGLFTLDNAGGSIMDDFDNDGLLDIVTSTLDPCGPLDYFHNDGNGIFTEYSSRAGLDGQLGGLNIVQTDYNNDGWMDITVVRGGWLSDTGQMRKSLLRNNGDGTFTDVTHESGLARNTYPSQSAAWADYDNDGDLDVYFCNESELVIEFGRERLKFPSELFRNNGDGTFVDVAPGARVTNSRFCKGAVWGDYDNDGDPDLYVSNNGSENRLYRNDGAGTFTDVALELGVTEPIWSFPTWFWDYDNDGWLDLFVADYGAEVQDVAADYLGLPTDRGRPRLYKNDGAGGFIDVTREAGLYRINVTMGGNFGDLDNDGFPDFYLGTGYPQYEAVMPNRMYRNNGGEGFVDVTFSGGFGHLMKGHGIAFGDLDRDGDQDIFAQIGGMFAFDYFANALYENPGHGNRWITVRLVGVESNRAAIGARIKVEIATDSGRRSVYAHVNSGGSFGASSLEQQIGLGQAQRIILMEVVWPTSGTTQVFPDLPLDTHFEVREGDDEYKVLDLPRVCCFESIQR